MDREAAWAAKSFPAMGTHMFPRFGMIMIVIGIDGIGRFRRGTSVLVGIQRQLPSETCERDAAAAAAGCGR
jgi:hypothetical protein